MKPDLNAGKGNPWAGHVRDKANPDNLSNVADLSSVVNFGPALPIGSVSKALIHDLPRIIN